MRNNKFRGGLQEGSFVTTWPNGVLEIYENHMILHNKMKKKKYEFSKQDVIKIEINTFSPTIGRGIRVHHNKDYDKEIYFWTGNLEKLTQGLKEFGWLDIHPE